MPLFFDWADVVLGPMLGAALAEAIHGTRAQDTARRASREQEAERRIERSRWLEEHRAERAFPCGLVPDAPEVENGLPRLNVVPVNMAPIEVTAAVLPHDLAFIRDGDEAVVEMGRIPRTTIGDIDVVDRAGTHVPEPIQETIEEPQLSLLVLRWTNEGVGDEDRFAFRSPWLAWRAGRKLLEARRG
jgi:hypothetical protein